MIEGSLEVKLPTIWRDEKQQGRGTEKREDKKRKSKRTDATDARIGRNVAIQCFSYDLWLRRVEK
jgi:hypothetical protein